MKTQGTTKVRVQGKTAKGVPFSISTLVNQTPLPKDWWDRPEQQEWRRLAKIGQQT